MYRLLSLFSLPWLLSLSSLYLARLLEVEVSLVGDSVASGVAREEER